MGREVNVFYSLSRDAEGCEVKMFSSDLANGIYYFVLTDGERSSSGKMIVQKP